MAQDNGLRGLEPAELWAFFADLSKIPRPSKHEERVVQWIIDIAKKNNLQWQQDKTGNIVVRRPGSGGGEHAPAVIIQGHVDMVTEKNKEVAHDFFKDAIRLKREGDWLKADGTTLGADNGIGVAAALALLVSGPEARLPPLECLFTVDEETGLTGAFGLDASILKGKTMLNLDTEDWNEIFIGCAGGGDSVLRLPVDLGPSPPNSSALELSITGLLGGHSGLNIGEDRGNAVKLSAQVLDAVFSALPEAWLAEFNAGDKRNALAREGYATVLVPSDKVEQAQEVVLKKQQELKEQYSIKETQLSVSLKESTSEVPKSVLSSQSTQKLLSLLILLPHGVAKMSHAVNGLVETSNNLAAVSPETGGSYKIIMSSRSSITAALDAQRLVIAKTAQLFGASVTQEDAYPVRLNGIKATTSIPHLSGEIPTAMGWAPNPSSKVVQLTKEVMEKISGTTPKVGAIHAGLECGLLGDKIPGMDMVSYGPTIRGAHSPDEKVQISTVEPFWQTTLQLLGRLADVKA